MALVPIYPSTLRQARKAVGLSKAKAADKLNVDVEKIESWETGAKEINLTQGRDIAQKYRTSLYALYLKDASEIFAPTDLIDFRKPESQEPYSYELYSAINAARDRQIWISDYLKNQGTEKLDWVSSISLGKISNVSRWVIEWLDVDKNHISKTKSLDKALDYWIDLIEAKGIVVVKNRTHSAYKIASEEYSGLVLYDDYCPVIMLNPADSNSRQIFTLIHELAHLLLRDKNSVSLIDFRSFSADWDEVEKRCNQIAVEVLVDDEYLLRKKEEYGKNKLTVVDSKAIVSEAAEKMRISNTLLAIRLKTLGYITQATLDELKNYYKEQWETYQAKKRGRGRTLPDKQAVDTCGKSFVRCVLEAYDQGNIDAIDIHSILGLKLKYLKGLSKRIDFPLHRWQEK